MPIQVGQPAPDFVLKDQDGQLRRLSDYHGAIAIPPGTAAPALGEIVAIVPNHVCPVVDLFDTFVATRAGSIVGHWPVDARGRSG